MNHSFCDSLPSTVQRRAVFNDVGKQICLNKAGWCNMLKDCVVARRTGTQGQWNCKIANLHCNVNQVHQTHTDPLWHAVPMSPFGYWKSPSSCINKVVGVVGGRSSENQHFSSLHLYEISPVPYLQKNCTSPNNACRCYLCNKGL